MRKTIYFVLLFALVACIFVQIPAMAQHSKEHLILLNTGTITPDANARQWLENSSQGPISGEPVQVLIHFSKLPTPEQRTLLQEEGITLLDYIPDNTFTAMVHVPSNTERILSTPIYGIINTKPEWKASEYVWNQVSAENGMIEALVSFYPNIDAAAIKQFISGIGGQVEPSPMERYSSYKVFVAASKIYAIAQWYGVRYISPVTGMVPYDLQSRPAVKGNVAVTSPAFGGYGLAGDSVTVGVGDNCSGIYHADLKDRITNFNPAPLSHHGEHVNGLVGGAASLDPLAASMAPHVSLVDFLYDLILPATGAMYHDYNMTITNNSYGVLLGSCSYSGTYDAYSQFLDTLAIQYPYVQHVFASGNDGGMNCTPYIQGFATVGGGYQPAKNNIVVGSMTDFLIEAGDESRGPVKDGRLKPEIIAIGLGSYSTIDIDQYAWSAGTSMASPQVAGGLAELTQRYKQLNSGAQPRADLLKAILLDGAMDLGNPGPDYSYGFGGMDIYRSLQIIDNAHFTSNTIANGDVQSFNITIPSNTAQVKVMLYWNDVPASPSSSKQLVNDLDLTVQDPASAVHLPLIPDPTPANVNNNATEQADHLNNIEQVTITNPVAGNYTINTHGYNVPSGTQHYVVVYDLIPKGVKLTFPLGGEQISNVDSMRIFWDAVTDGNSFTVQFSNDNGSNWMTLSNNIPPYWRYISFIPPAANTGNCLVRISRNNTTETGISGRFSMNTQPIVSLDTSQCPGYVNIHWSAVPNATSYKMLCKKGFYMQVVDSVTDTTWSFSGMSLTDKSYVAVQPIIDGVSGYRSVAASRIANSGNCTKPVSLGDIMIEKIVSPSSGRMFTSSQFGATTPVQVKIRNLYFVDCNNYTLSYSVNGGTWQTLTNPGTIPAKNDTIISIPGISFTALGTYNIAVAIHNLDFTDPQPNNDSTAFTILNLPNDTINLASPFSDGFETIGKFSVTHDSIGVSPNAHWDFFCSSKDTGRLRSFVDDDVTITGNRSISLDDNQNIRNGSKNNFQGTFNLSNYDTANTEVRVDFDYILHAIPKSANNNIVSARGSDTSAWYKLFAYDLNAYPGNVTHVSSLSLTDALRFSKRNFSGSTQLSFGQNDSSLIAAKDYGNGLTLDNFTIYTVTNDASLAGIVSPFPGNCGLPSSVPLIVQVHNGVSNTLYNIQLFYSMDSGTVYTGTIDSLKGKSDIKFTFSKQLNIAQGSTHILNVWLKEAGDSYIHNDSILNYHIRNSQIITSYPYLENFESGDGGFYSDGFKNSWQYGTPASPKINRAASGKKAWKTNLNGHYNNLEKSYLYSPCFDISQLANPMLSFSAALDVENCGGTLCDAAWIEYSFDGATWKKLGTRGQGTNWYDSTFDLWNTEGFSRWHVATIPIPVLGSGQTTHFRFVMSADPGVTFEGFAVDDIHIYDLVNPIAPATGVATLGKDLAGSTWSDYLLTNKLLAAVQPNHQNIDNAEITLYAQDTLSNPTATQYTMPRSYTFKAPQPVTNNSGIRLYLFDSEVVNVINDTTCPSCTPLADAYSLGITQYSNTINTKIENGTMTDDTGGAFTYYPYPSIKWVPYDKGYYAEFSAKPSAEFWFNNGGPTGNFPANSDYLNFLAFKSGQTVATYWYSLIDTMVNTYTVQRSDNGKTFTSLSDLPSRHLNPGQYTYSDSVNITADSVLYYRLRWTMAGKNGYNYSPVRKIDYSDSGSSLVTMDARMITHQNVLVSWTSYIDPVVHYYKLERAIGNGNYLVINNTSPFHLYSQQYSFMDNPGNGIHMGTPIHYRLTVVLNDGNVVVLPVHTIEWIDNNSVANIFPNPTYDGSITINWYADAGTLMHINFSDITGRKMYETTATSMQWNNTTLIQTANLMTQWRRKLRNTSTPKKSRRSAAL